MAVVSRRIDIAAGTAERQWQRSALLGALPPVGWPALIAPGSRAVVLAPHPDDEVLGCGALIALLAAAGRDVLLIAVTDGENSHAPPSRWAGCLGETRRAETAAALRCLDAAHVPVLRAGMPDGGLSARRADFDAWLRDKLRPGDTLFASWRLDGHPDHEALGASAASAAADIGCGLVEVPIWAWHWARPERSPIPWRRARKLSFGPATEAKKRAALQCYRSQIEADPSTGRAAVLPAHVLAHFVRPYEIYFCGAGV
ncbi:MAG: family deacetylase [Herbaspirillum sp.]|jgi:LmbE family N-acetylglucosaminyl deacetylase|nr:family deacetylase [Herbaspirillum sp.]